MVKSWKMACRWAQEGQVWRCWLQMDWNWVRGTPACCSLRSPTLPLAAINIYCFVSVSILMKIFFSGWGGRETSNNLGFFGMCAFHKGCGIGYFGLFISLTPEFHMLQVTAGACFCFLHQSINNGIWESSRYVESWPRRCRRCQRSKRR